MSRPSAVPLRVEAGPSRRLAMYLLPVHLAGLAVLPWLPLGLMALVAALILLASLAASPGSREVLAGAAPPPVPKADVPKAGGAGAGAVPVPVLLLLVPVDLLATSTCYM